MKHVKMNATPKKHHYVPRLILRHFCFDKQNLYVLDKKTGEIFPSSIRNAGSENDFYSSDEGRHQESIESKLSALETVSAPIFDRIIKKESLTSVTEYEHAIICLFVAVQLLRTNDEREALRQINSAICAWARRSGYDPKKDIENFQEMSEEDVKKYSIYALRTVPADLAKCIYEKERCLIKAPFGGEFYTSDHPVTMHNNFPRPGRGNLGLALKGIEVHFPISPNLCVSFMCPQTVAAIRTRVRKHLAMIAAGVCYPIDMSEPELFVDQFDRKIVREIKPENLEFHNSLQVSQSTRFLYSRSAQFELAKDMLKTNPELKEPRSYV